MQWYYTPEYVHGLTDEEYAGELIRVASVVTPDNAEEVGARLTQLACYREPVAKKRARTARRKPAAKVEPPATRTARRRGAVPSAA